MSKYSLDWLETALKNFKQQNKVIHSINGDMTMDEFIQYWCNEELSRVVKVSDCKHLHTEETHPYGWIACKDCGKLL